MCVYTGQKLCKKIASETHQILSEQIHLSRLATKPIMWLCTQRRLRSVWASADAQADLSLRWTQSRFVGFVTRRLICPCKLSALSMFSLPNHLCYKSNGLILSKVLLACLMPNNRKKRLTAAAALTKTVNVLVLPEPKMVGYCTSHF